MSSSAESAVHKPTAGRWWIVVAALLLQFSIGAVYAWSVFGKALAEPTAMNLSTSQASLTFTVTIGMIFIGSYVGGKVQDRTGPRPVALTGGVIYGIGCILASFAVSHDASLLWLLVLGYGVISGFGLGYAYIVPIAMLQKWFPDKRGLITGLAVAGFGFGAVVTAPVAQWLIAMTPTEPNRAFLPLGIGYIVLAVIGASFFRNPPAGYTVPGWTPSVSGRTRDAYKQFTEQEALRTPQWYLLTAILTLNVTVGIALIAQAAASAKDIAGYSVAGAAALVGVLALFNGGGRIFWAWISGFTGRMVAFGLMLGLQGVCLLIVPHASNGVLFFILAAIIYLCYGGGFGTMPATAGDFFGVKHAGAIYGLMIIGWSLGGIIGPPIIAALIGEDKNYVLGYTVIGIIALVSLVVPVITRMPKPETPATAVVVDGAGMPEVD
ncbi:OFA family MFS transporter [Microbacterium horticulturae]|uniref:OFA family MFS transporter n=1 Tax=Microbacterium horticulturae TaxID=3028316 RepID=A0ABY8C307_9MICO|nr:OFA family MFS transporter [Microbacterium sp. KACC 23027]WEG09742.1 OFA family MFS transporter [Microbacterium sp. KACC 23027]